MLQLQYLSKLSTQLSTKFSWSLSFFFSVLRMNESDIERWTSTMNVSVRRAQRAQNCIIIAGEMTHEIYLSIRSLSFFTSSPISLVRLRSFCGGGQQIESICWIFLLSQVFWFILRDNSFDHLVHSSGLSHKKAHKNGWNTEIRFIIGFSPSSHRFGCLSCCTERNSKFYKISFKNIILVKNPHFSIVCWERRKVPGMFRIKWTSRWMNFLCRFFVCWKMMMIPYGSWTTQVSSRWFQFW